jgi:hypothetical protein
VCLFVCLLVSLAGAHFFTKFNVLLFAIQIVGTFIGIFSFLIPHEYSGQDLNSNSTDLVKSHANFPNHFGDNVLPKWTNDDVCEVCTGVYVYTCVSYVCMCLHVCTCEYARVRLVFCL